MNSAGILIYRGAGSGLEVLLVHPGGPFWRHKDLGAWSIPKGEVRAGEPPETAARREFAEELGQTLGGELMDLGTVRQRAGKVVRCYAGRGDFEVAAVKSDLFEIEWPPRSGRRAAFPEIDRAAWFNTAVAKEKLLPSQRIFVDRLAERLSRG
ncbi:NUDIX domain-containing protein [Hansschlegelia zhihuaiae]|uniref:NUDIX domain-containing protein n=2 Tax=Hansschlegelia zhihuaiae TaxID=405005 RepID=A0A4Q0MIC1_9HYPH|nr:NUDIX domain-containing protein [Hansschlegelia zhihuaiae]